MLWNYSPGFFLTSGLMVVVVVFKTRGWKTPVPPETLSKPPIGPIPFPWNWKKRFWFRIWVWLWCLLKALALGSRKLLSPTCNKLTAHEQISNSLPISKNCKIDNLPSFTRKVEKTKSSEKTRSKSYFFFLKKNGSFSGSLFVPEVEPGSGTGSGDRAQSRKGGLQSHCRSYGDPSETENQADRSEPAVWTAARSKTEHVSQSCKRPKEKDCRRASAGACDNERLKEKLPEGLDLDVVWAKWEPQTDERGRPWRKTGYGG